MSAPTTAAALTGLSADVWQAARLAAGEDVPDASPAARELADQAVAAADRQWMADLDEADDGYVPSGKTGPRVSDYGGCGRAVWYRDNPPADYTPAKVNTRRATLGRVIHAAAEAARAARYPWRRYEMPIAIPGLDKEGKVDEYDPVLGEVTDGKTAGARKWESYGDDGVPAAAWGQVLIYAYALEQAGYPVRTVRVVAINRDTGDEEHFRDDYDPELAIAALDELVTLATALDMGIVPPRAGTGPDRFPCSWCEARLHCWNVDAAAAAGRSPESYTILGAEPDDPTVAWAASQVYDATKANTAAKNAKDAIAALLDGIPAGTYGEWEIGPRSRDMPDYKKTLGRVLALYPLPDAHRPPVEQIEAPDMRTDRWVGVKKVRAAKATKPRKSTKKAAAPAAGADTTEGE